jgi:N-acetylmuramic acid 6-phosphate etherase
VPRTDLSEELANMSVDVSDIANLETEQTNGRAKHLDRMSSLEIAAMMNHEDSKVAQAIAKALPDISQAIDIIADRLRRGGRLIYVGAGTSGRIGALDASECPPTFNVSPKTVQYVIAGGKKALGSEAEASEDSAKLGRNDIAARKPGKKDVVVGLAASGRTPYTIAAVEYARKKGTATIAIVCNVGSALAAAAELAIEVVVGPEVLTGSTRLKAGTAQKMVCNMLTTGAMARMGYVYGNLMVNVNLKNKKLIERGISILEQAADVDRESARLALEAAGMKLPVAVVMLKAGVGRNEALRRLKKTKGNVRAASSEEL